MSPRVLVVGGAGFFGRLVCEDLLRFSSCAVTVGGRDTARAAREAEHLAAAFPGRAAAAHADLGDAGSLSRAVEGHDAVVCAAGPFQTLPRVLLELCAGRKVPYVDLCDDPSFARRARESSSGALSPVRVGWSTTPALTGLLAAGAAALLDSVEEIELHMAPGSRGGRARGTVASLLHSAARSGWSSPRAFRFPPPVGERRGWLVDTADAELLPPLLGARSARFRAGAELAPLNAAARAWAAASRLGLTIDAWAVPAAAALRLLSPFGTSAGAVGAELLGAKGGRPWAARAYVVAASDGERIAAMPAAVEAARASAGKAEPGPGRVDRWLSWDELDAECRKRGWLLGREEAPA